LGDVLKKGFILACIASFIFLYEDLNHFFVLLKVGGFELEQATQKAFGRSSLEGALLAGSFRLIPFVPIILCAAYTKILASFKGRFSLCLSLVVAVFIIFNGYWSITSSLYTAEHASSTSALGYIFVPIAALFYSFCAGAGSYFFFNVYEGIFKRT
jgi:hypothetical protein